MSVKTPSSKPTNIKNELNLMNQWNDMTKLTTEEIEQISLLTNLSISSYDTPTQVRSMHFRLFQTHSE